MKPVEASQLVPVDGMAGEDREETEQFRLLRGASIHLFLQMERRHQEYALGVGLPM